MSACHASVGYLVLEQGSRLGDDRPPIRSDELEGAAFDPLRPLGLAAHYEHRLPKTRRLLLESAAVGEDQLRPPDAANGRRIRHGSDQPDPRDAVEDRMRD